MKSKILILLSFFTINVYSQEIHEKVATEICNCVDTIENIDSLDAKIDRCARQGFETVIEAASDEIQEIYSSDDAVEETVNKAVESLMTVCPRIRQFIIEERKKKFYTDSSVPEANQYFEKGNELFNKEDYRESVKLYLKAIRKDPGFIYAIDNAGLSYRKLGDTKKAIKYYKKSLSLYPEGTFALQNLAVACTADNDLNSALLCYQKLAFFYPDNPEGYFGIGRIYVASGNYETALSYLFTAHRIYTATKSEYASESEKLISLIYNKMRDENKLDIFKGKAKEFGITGYE